MTQKSRIKRELKKVSRLIDRCPEDLRDGLSGMAQHLAFVKVKLDEGKDECSEEGLTTIYDNGGGQIGTRENPKLKAYTNLLKTYISGMKELISAVPQESAAEEIKDQRNMLELIMDKRRASGE